MKRKDDPQIKALEWYLQFLSNDFDQMSELDLEKLIVEVRYYFMTPTKGVVAFMTARHLPSSITLLKEWGKDVKDLEEAVRVQDIDRVNYYVPTLWKGKFPAEYPWRDNLKLVQKELRSFLEERMRETDFIPAAKGVILFGRSDKRFKVIYNVNEPAFEEIKDAAKLVEMAKVSFMFALDNIPEGAIKTCRECGRLFLNLSKKPKYFCNFRCTSKAASRKRREQDPEKYRRTQKEIMRKRYKERKAKERNVPISKVRIQKRRPLNQGDK